MSFIWFMLGMQVGIALTIGIELWMDRQGDDR